MFSRSGSPTKYILAPPVKDKNSSDAAHGYSTALWPKGLPRRKVWMALEKIGENVAASQWRQQKHALVTCLFMSATSHKRPFLPSVSGIGLLFVFDLSHCF